MLNCARSTNSQPVAFGQAPGLRDFGRLLGGIGLDLADVELRVVASGAVELSWLFR